MLPAISTDNPLKPSPNILPAAPKASDVPTRPSLESATDIPAKPSLKRASVAPNSPAKRTKPNSSPKNTPTKLPHRVGTTASVGPSKSGSDAGTSITFCLLVSNFKYLYLTNYLLFYLSLITVNFTFVS